MRVPGERVGAFHAVEQGFESGDERRRPAPCGVDVQPESVSAANIGDLRDRIDGARSLLARRGSIAVFLGRSIAFFRAVMPALAGMALMPYRRFLVANAAGGLVWGVATVLLGFLAGNSYQRVEKAFGRGAAIAVAAVVVLAIGAWVLRRRRSERR